MRIFRTCLHSSDFPTRAEPFESAITVCAPIIGLQALELLT